mmetsp:Transcript_11753/g.19172  ORF Transcript_11753/g.19172 Transcript_11753/m.19172 type:complete len:98 (+) Transcript_11753:665-958(+)
MIGRVASSSCLSISSSPIRTISCAPAIFGDAGERGGNCILDCDFPLPGKAVQTERFFFVESNLLPSRPDVDGSDTLITGLDPVLVFLNFGGIAVLFP